MAWTTTGELVTAAKLNEVFPSGDDAWQDWSPTYANLTIGNGTVVARYHQVGKTVVARFTFTLGSTSSVGGAPTVSMPVSPASLNADLPIGVATYVDAGSANFQGIVNAVSSVFNFGVNDATGTYLFSVGISGTVPFSWTTNDLFQFTATYEAA